MEEKAIKTIKQFTEENKITMTVTKQLNNSLKIDVSNMWGKDATHWKCVLKMGKNGQKTKQMTIFFHQGSGIKREPTAEDLLNCIGLDSYVYLDNNTFEEFCGEFGYGSDKYSNEYKNIQRIYNAVMIQGKQAEKFLGRELLEELAYNTKKL